MNSYTNPSNLDNILLQTLMNRLQIRPQTPLLNQTLEDLLLDTINAISESEDDVEDEENSMNSKTHLAKEESRLEKEVIKIILGGKAEEMLKPNSGQAVAIGEHHICVGYHVESGSEYRVWEWHGHVMLFDEENGYSPEYIYGNYFERLRAVTGKMKEEAVVEKEEDDGDKIVNSGLKELVKTIEGSGLGGTSEECGLVRILHRSMNAGSSRV